LAEDSDEEAKEDPKRHGFVFYPGKNFGFVIGAL
jgi:hypothetical protein